MKLIRQGDVLLKQVRTIPTAAKKQEGPCILAYGEVTGHSHQVKEHGEIWVDVNDHGRRYLKVLDDTTLDHEEHRRAALTKGEAYEIVIQREYHPDAIRTVVD
jgi:hypothetical protein